MKEPMSHAESVASSAVCENFSPSLFPFSFLPNKQQPVQFFLIFYKVRAALTVKAAIIVVFTSSGGAARCSTCLSSNRGKKKTKKWRIILEIENYRLNLID